MVVDIDKFICQSPKNIQIAPHLGINLIKVHLHYDLIDIIQKLRREISKSKIFTALRIHLQDYVLLHQVTAL